MRGGMQMRPQTLAALALAALLSAGCAGEDDSESALGSAQAAVEGSWGCSKQVGDTLEFVAEGGADCPNATLLAYPVKPRSQEVKNNPGNAGDAGNSNHVNAVQQKVDALNNAGTVLFLPSKDKETELHYKGKLLTEVGIKLQAPFFDKLGLPGLSATLKGGSSTELDVSFTVKDAMTLFVSDPHEIGPVIDRFEESCGEWKKKGDWLVAHSHLTIWHTTSLSDGNAKANDVVRTLSLQLEGNPAGSVAPVGSIEDSATLSWKKTGTGTWAVRRIFPLPEVKQPSTAQGDGQDDIESSPGKAKFPWTAHGIAQRLLRPSIGEPVQCRRARPDKGTLPMYFKDGQGKLTPILCYERAVLYRELFDNLSPTPEPNAPVTTIAGLLVPGQWFWVDGRAERSRLGNIKLKQTMWDRLVLLDKHMLPADIINAKGEKIDPKACATTLPECPIDSGLAPYYDPTNDTCRCVPSVGHKARESFAKYAVPYLELVARDGGAFGFRKAPNFVAKRKDNNSGELIDTLHACWCDLHLESTTGGAHELPSTKKKDTGTDILLVPPASYTGFCHQLDGKTVGSHYKKGWGGSATTREIKIKGCIRAEVPWDLSDGTNSKHIVGKAPKHMGLGDGWSYVVGFNGGFAMGRTWTGALEDDVTFKGKVGTHKEAGEWRLFEDTKLLTDPGPEHGWPKYAFK